MHDIASKPFHPTTSVSVAGRRTAWALTGLTVAVAACAVGAGRVDQPLCVWLAIGLSFYAGGLKERGQRRLSQLTEISFAPSPSDGAETRDPAATLPRPAGSRMSGAAQ